MSNWQKIIVGIFAALVWIATVIGAFLYPALAAPLAEIKTVAQSVLGGLGIYHLAMARPPADSGPDSPAKPVTTTVTHEP